MSHQTPGTSFYMILHNETADAIKRCLQWQGTPEVFLPIRVDILKSLC
jgi:hypothetical protein